MYDVVTHYQDESFTLSILGKLSLIEFDHLYQGVIFFPEVTDLAGEENYPEKARKQNLRKRLLDATLLFIPISILAIGFYNLFILEVGQLFPFLYSMLSLVGWSTCVLLLWYEIDSGNIAIREVCGGNKEKSKGSCDAVLQSSAASIFGVSWSRVGFAFFSALLIGQIVAGYSSSHVTTLLFLISTLSVVFVPFSLVYQARVAKQWCPLCVTVQIVLILQFVVSILAQWHNEFHISNLSISSIFAISAIGVFTLLLISQLAPMLKRNIQLELDNHRLNHFKFDYDTFEASLQKQPSIANMSLLNVGLTLGNPNAKHTIVKVCNPFCAPCSNAHPKIEELLDKNDEINVHIIFTVRDDENDHSYLPVSHFLALADLNDPALLKRALSDWYGSSPKNYEEFAKKYPLNGALMQQQEKIKTMEEWCNTVKVEYTPTYFVNGHKLPEHYNITDLNYLLKI